MPCYIERPNIESTDANVDQIEPGNYGIVSFENNTDDGSTEKAAQFFIRCAADDQLSVVYTLNPHARIRYLTSEAKKVTYPIVYGKDIRSIQFLRQDQLLKDNEQEPNIIIAHHKGKLSI